jgi:acetyl esterase/lipase
MKKSLSYYITIFVLKIKGLKKNFSQDPIDFKKLRKEDVYKPNKSLFKDYRVEKIKIDNTTVTEIKGDNESNQLLIFIHGGAFVSGPAQHHWDAIKEIIKQTDFTIWMCDYPKAPENNIIEISKNIDAVYNQAIKQYRSNNIKLIGDSVGGTLIVALTQRLIENNIELPNQLVLLSPVMDASLSNSKIDSLDKVDPMLSKVGVLSSKKMCAVNNDLNDKMISPINGNFHQFPKTVLFLAENDITYPDQLLAVEKMKGSGVDTEVIIGKGMPHVWPILPVMKEAKLALQEMINRIG